MLKSQYPEIENEYVEFKIENGIIMEVFKPGVTKINLPIAKKIVSDRLKISNGTVMPLFIDIADIRSVDKEAREYFASPESVQLVSASAFLFHNYVAWLVGKIFLEINRPKANIELFKSRAKALEWLQYFKNSN